MAERAIHEMEENAAAVAKRALVEPLKAAISVLNLATKLHANDVPEERISKVKIVRLLLLQRTQNDLRCCMILVEHGYPLQAVTQAASIFEAWVTIANLKTEDDAVRWFSHAKENESFGRIRPLTRQALENIVGDAKDADRLYSQYQQLCMPKHLNPIIERSRGYVLDCGRIEFRPGPDTSELAVAHGWYALERAARFALFALLTIAHSQGTSPDLHRELAEQQIALNALQDESVKRWPDNYVVETISAKY
jgi:hypothetical protein